MVCSEISKLQFRNPKKTTISKFQTHQTYLIFNDFFKGTLLMFFSVCRFAIWLFFRISKLNIRNFLPPLLWKFNSLKYQCFFATSFIKLLTLPSKTISKIHLKIPTLPLRQAELFLNFDLSFWFLMFDFSQFIIYQCQF